MERIFYLAIRVGCYGKKEGPMNLGTIVRAAVVRFLKGTLRLPMRDLRKTHFGP